jgi:hypothetical protein
MSGTVPCIPCLEARATYVKAWRVKTGRARNLSIPVDVLRQALDCCPSGALAAFLGEEVTEAVMQAPKAIRVAAT